MPIFSLFIQHSIKSTTMIKQKRESPVSALPENSERGRQL
ncbi:hypothetical protein HMPREF0293_2204 [Corynebacterium glucuronolyticum ATCC 51866]|uniref:Uncharacterized protein n=1 Tax=Corynebacterium glucuronolyticum ATCC 51866 TaxID=548478 RepID=A0ABM9XMB8_9CORY|nr:hypothetical protein HMPREF0293_2204 [Corynebacterium glucuronolyticum ATCC 51866]